MDFIGLVWAIPVVLGLAALINGLGCRKLGKTAGHIAWGAMAFAFVLSTAIFFQVKGITGAIHHGQGHGEGGDHAAHAEDHGHGGDHGHALAPLSERWDTLSHDQQEAIKAQNLFVRAENPQAPEAWETTVREGLGGHVPLWTWFDIPNVFNGEKSLTVEFAFHVDQLTAIFLMFVSFVGLLVFIYATGYMKEEHHGHLELDEGYARFFSYLSLFAASMFTLILGANFVVMFIGWEGVGLCSYLLIGYYFDRQFSEKLSCADAGKKAFVVNRVGDFGLVLGMALLFWGFGTLDFQELITAITAGSIPEGFGYNGAIITAAALLLFLGATGKSAQIPLFVWLPDAMAGPTPVSALIHAATMVTAGVYMLARLNVVYMMAPTALAVVAVVGALTAFVAAFAGLTQRGIKKILAYSTVSQLGYMFLAIGVGAFWVGIFHVFTHAFFKACLFLSAGSIIHALHHEEDVFKMGGLRHKMKLTHLAYLFATIAIAGIPVGAGFFSKDEILLMTFIAGQGNSAYMILYGIGIVTAAFTSFYMFRSYFLAFHGKPRMSQEKYDHVHESPSNMTGVIMTLGILSLMVGFLYVALPGLPKITFFHHFLAPVTDRGALHVAQTVHGFTGSEAPYGAILVGKVGGAEGINYDYHAPVWLLALFSIAVAVIAAVVAWVMYGSGDLEKSRKVANNPLAKPAWKLSWNAWWWDDIYDAVFVRGFMIVYSAVLWFDRTVVDGVVNGAGKVSQAMSTEFRRLQNGQVQIYGLMMFIGVCLFVVYFALGLWTFIGDNRVRSAERKAAREATSQVSTNSPQSGAAVALADE